MIDVFKQSFRLKNTYRTNGIIYSLKSLPIIKKFLPGTLYDSEGLKQFANVISMIGEILSVFYGKILYILLLVWLPAVYMPQTSEDFLHILLLLTPIGAILNTQIFNSSKDKHYAIFLMRMDAKSYTLVNYIYFLGKTAVGFLPVVIVFGILTKSSIVICLLLPFYIIAAKSIMAVITLWGFKKKNKIQSENHALSYGIPAIVFFLLVAYVPPCFGYVLSTIITGCIIGVVILAGVFAIRYILQFDRYRYAYKQIYAEDGTILNGGKATTGKIAQGNYQKKLDNADNWTSDKNGYAYFHEIFMKRHHRLLLTSAKRMTVVLAVILVVAIIGCLCQKDVRTQANKLLLVCLPVSLFLMYFINRGKVITEAMFMNCDHSMLTFRFYRKPEVILKLFAARLKSIVWINLMPASVVAIGLPVLLWISGGTKNPWNYVILPASVLAMSVFFSVHNMVLYYLLQPYNMDIEIKSPLYSAISTATYFVCYLCSQQTISNLLFGTLVFGFCILYILIALVLAYHLAPKTFRLHS